MGINFQSDDDISKILLDEPSQFRSVFFDQFAPAPPLPSVACQRSLFFCFPVPLQCEVMEAPTMKGFQQCSEVI